MVRLQMMKTFLETTIRLFQSLPDLSPEPQNRIRVEQAADVVQHLDYRHSKRYI